MVELTATKMPIRISIDMLFHSSLGLSQMVQIAAARKVMHGMKQLLALYCTDMYGVLETPPTLILWTMAMVSESLLRRLKL